MSNISSKKADKAIQKAIDKASYKVCQQVNLDDFDPWNQKSQNGCRQFFDREIDKENQKISEDQDALVLISYSATLGWLYGYSCAQEEALSTISAEDDDISYQDDEIERSSRYLSDAQEDLTEETEEPANSESSPDNDIVESEEPEATDKEGLLQKLRRAIGWPLGIGIAIGIAIGAGITIIVCIIIDSQMMG